MNSHEVLAEADAGPGNRGFAAQNPESLPKMQNFAAYYLHSQGFPLSFGIMLGQTGFHARTSLIPAHTAFRRLPPYDARPHAALAGQPHDCPAPLGIAHLGTEHADDRNNSRSHLATADGVDLSHNSHQTLALACYGLSEQTGEAGGVAAHLANRDG